MGDSPLAADLRVEVTKLGFPVLRGSPYCQQFLDSHPNCAGCESEHGCSRVAACVGIIESAPKTDDPRLALMIAEGVSEVVKQVLKDGIIKDVTIIIEKDGKI